MSNTEKVVCAVMAVAIAMVIVCIIGNFFLFREDGTFILDDILSESRTNKTEANVRVLWSENGVWSLRIEGHNYLATGFESTNYKTLVHAASCPCGHANANMATK